MSTAGQRRWGLFQKQMMGVFDGTFILPPLPMRFNYCLGLPPIKSNYQSTPPPDPYNFFFSAEPPFKELEEGLL